jgi:hypothetical protein
VPRIAAFVSIAFGVLCGAVALWGFYATAGVAFFQTSTSLKAVHFAYLSVGLLGLGAWTLEQIKSRG